jgi:hypothetical protein
MQTPALFEQFVAQTREFSEGLAYGFSKAKAQSCHWMIKRIPAGARVVDVGGTEYLCEQLAAKGCDVTYYDIMAPRAFPHFVKDDMFNVVEHFPERSLDVITTRHTLEHSLVPLWQLWCYNRLLKDDGRLLVIVPHHSKAWVWYRSHFNCLPIENWLMLFHRAGFKVIETDAGSWKPKSPGFVEWRFQLAVESRALRLSNEAAGALVGRRGSELESE